MRSHTRLSRNGISNLSPFSFPAWKTILSRSSNNSNFSCISKQNWWNHNFIWELSPLHLPKKKPCGIESVWSWLISNVSNKWTAFYKLISFVTSNFLLPLFLPGIPLSPGSPWSPGNPGWPMSPSGPGNPTSPGSPFNPGNPNEPGNPGRPDSPLEPVQVQKEAKLTLRYISHRKRDDNYKNNTSQAYFTYWKKQACFTY